MSIRFLSLSHLVTASVLLSCALLCKADEFHDPAQGYSIELPSGWTQIPDDVLEQALSVVYGQDSKRERAFSTAFQPNSPWPGISYPYVLVRVVPLSEYGIHSQIDEDEFPRLMQTLTSMEPDEFLANFSDQATVSFRNLEFATPQLDSARRRYFWEWRIYVEGVGPVHSFMAVYFGRDSLTQVIFYSQDSESSRYAAVCQSIIDSFRFDSDRAYNVTLKNANPQIDTMWSSVFKKGMIGALVGAVISFVVGTMAKSGRQSRKISNITALLIVVTAVVAFGSPLLIAACR